MLAVGRRRLFCLSLILFVFSVFGGTRSFAQEKVTVFAAASLKDVLEAAASEYKAANPAVPDIVLSFAASSALAKQIEAGAKADIFISADTEWMDWAMERKLVAPASRRDLARNTLVIAKSTGEASDSAAAALEGVDRIAMGDPAHVPAGKYAKQALESLGLWESVLPRAAFGENVRVALGLAERGEVGAAIVYKTDLLAGKNLKLAFEFPASSHAPIVYPAALTAVSQQGAAEFLDFLSGEQGKALFARFGFSPAS